MRALFGYPQFRIVDEFAPAWHSRLMPTRGPHCRFLIALMLSHALVIQALLLGWSGALAAGSRADGLGAICVVSGPLRSNDSDSGPVKPSEHHDCASACVSAQGTEPPQPTLLARAHSDFTRVSLPAEAAWLRVSEAHAFSARAPPATI